MMGSGILSVIADWPRPAGEESNAKVVKFVTSMQQAHRGITAFPVTPDVSKSLFVLHTHAPC